MDPPRRSVTDGATDWQLIPNYPGFHISRDGVVTNDRGEMVEPWVKDGELWVEFAKYEWSFVGPIWMVMLLGWYDNGFAGISVEYSDGDPNNLTLENLVFVEQMANSERMWPIPFSDLATKRRFDRRRGKPVMVVETGEIFESAAECAKSIGGQAANVSACLRGTLKSHKGFTFRHV